MNYDEFNYASLMAVVRATMFDEDGAYIPGELMPSGNPVRASGVDRSFLTNKDMVAQWAAAVKGAYEREISEKNQEGSEEDVQDVRSGREDTPAAEHGGHGQRHTPAASTVEEELEARKEAAGAALDRARRVLYQATDQVASADRELRIITAALAAIREASSSASTAVKKKRGRPKIHREVG